MLRHVKCTDVSVWATAEAREGDIFGDSSLREFINFRAAGGVTARTSFYAFASVYFSTARKLTIAGVDRTKNQIVL